MHPSGCRAHDSRYGIPCSCSPRARTMAVRSGALRQTPQELDTGHLLHNPADVFDGSHREAAVDARSCKGEFRSGCVEANGLRPQPM